ncbi:hypothetical protein BVG16_02495 [Paenibacillus selenitireducens]|uniref:HTH araC/xylS-type domain-containing protein n=1 Tax=Paenibacillus selenitireducens TaxID=1324314 RepID=A0A1T2XNU2_9BACL|nr:helix-turn-helix domain-containing protein [Paenibacillus selenitireducens]OPA81534.1 hypothetical protein BVG16_02495 [Paenibacillus selenitireducens]
MYTTKGIRYLSSMLYETFRIPVGYRNSTATESMFLPSSFQLHPRFRDISAVFDYFIHDTDPGSKPVLCSTNFLEYYVVMQVQDPGKNPGMIVLGPTIPSLLSEETMQNLFHDFQVPRREQEQWAAYYRQVPQMSNKQFIHAALLLHFLVYGKTLEFHDVIIAAHPKDSTIQSGDDLRKTIAERRELRHFHQDPTHEAMLFQLIKQGKKEELLRLFPLLSDEKMGTLSKRSHLRSYKNLAITAITLATRAAIEGGLFWEAAYSLSDLHIQQIEELKEKNDVEKALVLALVDFTERVHARQLPNVSAAISRCQNYIFNHLYEEISLTTLAEITNLHANYLSQRFKKEVGISVSEYIQRQRIEEAKELLTLSDFPLSEICSRLTFHDQSYFTKVFKKYTGMTPKQYRKQRQLIP